MTSNVTIRVPSIKKDAEQVWHGTNDDVARSVVHCKKPHF